MGEVQLMGELDLVAAALADGGRGPLAHAVHGQDGGLGEGRREEGRGRVRLVVLREEDGALIAQGLADLGLHPELLLSQRGTAMPNELNPAAHRPGRS